MMIKELWTLIKMLFSSSPKDTETVKVMDMQHFPFKGYKAMSWCGCIIHRADASPVDTITINHEHIHLMQAKVCGSWCRYYIKYLWEWLKGGIITHPASAAYYTSKYESEAYANETDFTYCRSYDGTNLKKYTFRNRKKLYRQLGGTPESWKAYIKSL